MTNGAVLLPQKAQHFSGIGVASIRFWVKVIFTLSVLAYKYRLHGTRMSPVSLAQGMALT